MSYCHRDSKAASPSLTFPDRFNGYTWQTRTLEVRPDRLPPEYEPQPQQNHHSAPARPPMYTYHNMSGGGHAAFTLPGHMLPSNGPAWLPGQLPQQRPPMNGHQGGSGGSQQMMGVLSMPGMSLSPHAPPMSLSGSSPLQPGPSPNPMYGNGGLPLPLSGQNTGNHIYQTLGASPLAGSLSAGIPLPGHNNARRDSLTPFAHSIPPDEGSLPRPRSTSPSLNTGPSQSRPSSSSGRPTNTSSPPRDAHSAERSRVPPAHLASVPMPSFSTVKNVLSPTDIAFDRRQSTGSGSSPPVPQGPPGGIAHQMPMNMEGLAHQGPGLGPPSTLHDRVVFVSNVRKPFESRHQY